MKSWKSSASKLVAMRMIAPALPSQFPGFCDVCVDLIPAFLQSLQGEYATYNLTTPTITGARMSYRQPLPPSRRVRGCEVQPPDLRDQGTRLPWYLNQLNTEETNATSRAKKDIAQRISATQYFNKKRSTSPTSRLSH